MHLTTVLVSLTTISKLLLSSPFGRSCTCACTRKRSTLIRWNSLRCSFHTLCSSQPTRRTQRPFCLTPLSNCGAITCLPTSGSVRYRRRHRRRQLCSCSWQSTSKILRLNQSRITYQGNTISKGMTYLVCTRCFNLKRNLFMISLSLFYYVRFVGNTKKWKTTAFS